MSDSADHYVLAVLAPALGLACLRGGFWVIMANKPDMAALEPLKGAAVHCVSPAGGSVAIFRLPGGRPEGARLAWSHNMRDVPEFKTLTAPPADQREAFWAFVHKQVQMAITAQGEDEAAAPAGVRGGHAPAKAGAAAPAARKGQPGARWWILGAAAAAGLMAYAMLPELFHNFNWQGRWYETTAGG